MSDLSSRIAALPPEKRLLLEMKRAEKRGQGVPGRPPEPVVSESLHTEPFSLISPEDRRKLPADVVDAYPLSATQMGMLFHMEPKADSAPPAYHNVNSFHLQFPFNPELMQIAVDRVVARHPILRTSFDLTNYSEPMQLVHRSASLRVQVEDLRHLPAEQQNEIIRNFIKEENFRLIDLSRAPVLRFYVHWLTDDVVKLTLTEPHLISDGWSTHLTMEETFRHYDALLNNRPAPDTTPLPVAYRDFIAMERETMGSEKIQRFWDQKLERFSANQLHLMPRWPENFRSKSSLGDHKLYLNFDPQLVDSLYHLAQSTSVPIKSVVLAAHLKAMSLLTGQADVMTGLVFNGRPEVPGGDQVRGLFLNTLPLLFEVPHGSWRDLIRQAYAAEIEILPYRRYPLAAIQHKWGRQAIFESGFQFLHFHSVQSLLRSGQVAVIEDTVDYSTTNFPWTVSFVQDPIARSEFRVIVEYDVTEFCKEQAVALQGYLMRILNTMCAEPDANHAAHSFLSPAEQDRLLTWNATKRPYPDKQCLHELFEAQAHQSPDAVAVVFEGRQLTYRELDRRANRLAHHLRSLGVGPEVLVGVALERSEVLLVALLAVLKAGGAYVPLDPTYPSERLAYILQDSQAPVLLTQPSLQGSLPDYQGQTVVLDSEGAPTQAAPSDSDAAPANTGVTPQHLAYVIYTSGSTGKPKGVRVQHRSVANFLHSMAQEPGLTADDTLVAVTTFSFDISILELFLPLTVGARVVVASREVAADGARLMTTLARHNATVMQATPTTWRLLLESGWQGDQTLIALCGGEALPKALALELAQRVEELWNVYGPTETTIWSATTLISPTTPTITIGRPIANTQVYILDDAFQPLPVATPGNLYIGGAGLARDYLGRPELTAERFVPHPFSAQLGERLYWTGDLARRLPDGTIEFLGRIDDQVKVRGFRIELGEIEAVLGQHPAVREAVVVAREDQQPGHKRLVAYLVPRTLEANQQNGHTSHEPLLSEVQDFLKAKLPDYMVPTAFVVLDTFPLTSSGKINRRALPAPALSRPELKVAYAPPRTPVEEKLAAIWAQVLRLERVGIHDNFFELGGDSILTVQVVARANQAGLRITATKIFQNPTVSSLATVAEIVPIIEADQGIVTGEVPPVPFQEWLLGQGLTDLHHWSRSILLELRQPIDASALQEGVRHLLAHHDALRLRVQRGEDGWRQYNAGLETDLPFSRIDLAGRTAQERDEMVAANIEALQARLDLAEGPLVQVALFEFGPSQPSRLFIAVHQWVADAISWHILLDDLFLVLETLAQHQPVMLPLKTSAFKQWAERLAAHTASDPLEADREYWLVAMRQEVAPLPLDSEPSAVAPMGVVTTALDAAETDALLREVPAAYNIQVADALLAALAQSLTAWTGQPSLLVDLEHDGRDPLFETIDLSRTVGRFTTRYPLLLDTTDIVAPDAALKSVKEQVRQVPNSGIGYGLLRYLSGDVAVAEQLAALPAAQVRFRHQAQQALALADPSPFALLSDQSGHQDDAPYLLSLTSTLDAGQLQLEWRYNAGAYQRPTIERLAQRQREAVRAMIAHCQSLETRGYTPSDFPEADLSQDELEDLIAELSGFEE
jgi:microcystin synthetase protein McyA